MSEKLDAALRDSHLGDGENEYRQRLKLETIIFGHFNELFPNYTYTDQWCAVDLMAAEIKTLRIELERMKMAMNHLTHQRRSKMSDETKTATCQLCGEPMPPGEQMFYYHGYSGPCPKPPLSKPPDMRGIYEKFKVERIDGKQRKGEKHHGCQYFVLDIDHDPHALPAIRAYAESCSISHPNLANDLRAMAGQVERHGRCVK